MTNSYLRANTVIKYHGEPHILHSEASAEAWTLRNVKTGRFKEVKTSRLLEDYTDGALTFPAKEITHIAGSKSDSRSFRELNKNVSESAKLRLAFVRELIGAPTTKSIFDAIIVAKWNELPPEARKTLGGRPPSFSSAYRWIRAYTQSDNNPLALIAGEKLKGNRKERFDNEVLAICQDAIEDAFLCRERNTIQYTADIANGLIVEANKLRPATLQLTRPTRRLITRLVKKIPAYDRDVARYSEEYARKKYRSVNGVHAAERPLERVEMDHTRLDIFVVSKEGYPLGRPWLTVLIDVNTRAILGICISFEPPSRATVARCLKHALLPKTKLREQFPNIDNEWEPFGVFEQISLDGGIEFHSFDIETTFFELGTEQHFAPRKTPWFKPLIERFIGTLNRSACISIPGKTFCSITEKEDYDPSKHAVIDVSTLYMLVNKWIVDVYHQKTHRSLGCTPMQKWRSGIRLEDIPLFDDPVRFDAIVGGRIANATLRHDGVTYKKLRYNSPELADMRKRYGSTLKVEVRFDRSDLGHVIVIDPKTSVPHRVPCLQFDYANGLTEWQHNLCSKYAKDKLKNDNPDGWLQAQLAIHRMVRELVANKHTKINARARVGRWLEGSHPTETQETPVPTLELPQKATAMVELAPSEITQAMSPSPGALTTAPTQVPDNAPILGADYQPIPRKRFTPILTDRALEGSGSNQHKKDNNDK